MRRALLALLLVTSTLAGCTTGGDGASASNPIEPCGSLDQSYDPAERFNPRVRLETSEGGITIAAYLNQVPFVAGTFVDRAASDGYNGTRFHKLFPNELIIGGDPNSRGDRSQWGRGASIKQPDQFHQFLRHSEEGTVSLWSPTPHGGGAMFLITLKPQPSLDDRHPVFGKVLEGMETVREISKIPTDDRNRPKYGAKIQDAELLEPQASTEQTRPNLSAYGFDCVEVAEPGEEAEYMVAVRNTGQALLNGTFEADAPDGWSVELRNKGRLPIPSGQTVTYPLNVTVPASASTGTEHEIELTWSGTQSNASITRTVTTRVASLGPMAGNLTKVKAHYVGTLEDARPFDTTVDTYATSANLTWIKQAPNATEAVTVDTSSGQIGNTKAKLPDGMVTLLQRANVGETVVASIPPSEAYGAKSYGQNGLGGRVLYFQIHVLGEA